MEVQRQWRQCEEHHGTGCKSPAHAKPSREQVDEPAADQADDEHERALAVDRVDDVAEKTGDPRPE